MSIVRNIWFWLVLVGVLLIVLGIISFWYEWLSATLSIIVLAVGFLLLIIGAIGWYRKSRKSKGLSDEEEPVGEEYRRDLGALREKMEETVPQIGTVAGKALGYSLVKAGDATFVASTVVNNLTSKGIDLSTAAIVKIRRMILMIIVSALLSVATSGVGGVVAGGGGVAGVASTVAGNIGGASSSQIAGAIGSQAVQTVGKEAVSLGTKGASKGISSLARSQMSTPTS